MSTNLGAKFVVRFPPNSAGESEAILFSDVKRMNSKLRTFDFQYWALPNLDPCWKALENSSLASVQPLLVDDLDLSENCVCRGASRAKVVDSLTDLKETVKDMYADGERASDNYICIPTEIIDGKVLTIRDANGELISMVITNIAETLPHLPEAGTTIVSAIMEGEVYPVILRHQGIVFCAIHNVIYNRYTEQGTDAPDGVHPNRLRREGASKVNFKKRPTSI
ncbi:hypothetical protein B0H14DRAFT_2556564 [Mycena olivaceomarginata]|nr:hypothetical protein B0H14DRAFT_2556564 [Mycena olivaceomarginata]